MQVYTTGIAISPTLTGTTKSLTINDLAAYASLNAANNNLGFNDTSDVQIYYSISDGAANTY